MKRDQKWDPERLREASDQHPCRAKMCVEQTNLLGLEVALPAEKNAERQRGRPGPDPEPGEQLR
jgi:hypothetical protein